MEPFFDDYLCCGDDGMYGKLCTGLVFGLVCDEYDVVGEDNTALGAAQRSLPQNRAPIRVSATKILI